MGEPHGELVFSSAVEGLFLHGLRGRVSPELIQGLRKVGIDLERRLDPAYPVEVWAEALKLAAQVVYPGLPLEQGLANLGRHTFEGFSSTLIGRAMVPLLKVLGPQRTLARMSRNFQNANNYTRCEVTPLGSGESRIWLSRVINAEYYEGILEAGMSAAGARDVRVELSGRETGGASFLVRWT